MFFLPDSIPWDSSPFFTTISENLFGSLFFFSSKHRVFRRKSKLGRGKDWGWKGWGWSVHQFDTSGRTIPIGSMGRTVYLPTFTIKFNQMCRYICQSHGSYGVGISVDLWDFPPLMWLSGNGGRTSRGCDFAPNWCDLAPVLVAGFFQIGGTFVPSETPGADLVSTSRRVFVMRVPED